MLQDQDSARDNTGRPASLWFALSVLAPMIAAIGIAVHSLAPTGPRIEEVAPSSFVLERDSASAPADSVRALYERTRRLLTVFRADEAFLDAMLSETGSREASLWIDMRDSLATLTIQGVPVRVNRILSSEKSILLDRMRSRAGGMDSLRTPFRLVAATSNIPRIPMRLVHAPKDTAEARLRPPDAFVAEEGHVFARLQFSRNLVLFLEPPAADGRRWKSFTRSSAYRISEAVSTVKAFVSNESRPPMMWVRLEMSSEDIRAVYRALPDGGAMALRW